jgi:hypothetical protein
LHLKRATVEKSRIRIRIRNPVYGSRVSNPDPPQNVTDPEHWYKTKNSVCADEAEAGGSEDYPHLQGEEENTLEDSKEDETMEGKGDQFVPVFQIPDSNFSNSIVGPDRTLHFDADPDPDQCPSCIVIHVGKSEK